MPIHKKFNNFPYETTPINYFSKISEELNVKFWCKRDDFFYMTGSGNKARKLKYILASAKKNGNNAVVTAGGIQSNHVRATALMCAELGWKSIMIIHDKQPPNTILDGNLKLTNLVGSEIRYVDKNNVSSEMDNAMQELTNQGYNPLYIWGGGHCAEGSYAYYEAIKEVKNQLTKENYPDYIVLASGTGTTQAGIELGCKVFLPNCKVIGISVAREKKRGVAAINDSIIELGNCLGIDIGSPDSILFDDRWVGDGYESTYPELLKTIQWAAKTEGLILDPTYTGKAFHALIKLIENKEITTNSKVLFWHTGGLLNLMSSQQI